ncbi:hypothetical protein Brsp05_03474 [Brucella sp. NBRC 12953]
MECGSGLQTTATLKAIAALKAGAGIDRAPRPEDGRSAFAAIPAPVSELKFFGKIEETRDRFRVMGVVISNPL